MGRIFGAVALFVVLLGIYLFFAGEINTVEVVAGIVCAAAGTGLGIGSAVVAKQSFAFAPPWRALAAPFAALLPETLVVGRELVAAAVAGSGADGRRGDFIRQPFRPGDAGDPRTSGRRALTIIGVSMAPRTFVVRGERSDTLLLHGLPAKPPSPDDVWPT